LFADCDPAVARASRRTLDVAGHYGRPDVFGFTVDRSANRPAHFSDDARAAGETAAVE
jgi:nitrilase